MSNGADDLTKQLNSFTISPQEEQLTQRLDQTHLSPSNSVFALPAHFQQQQQQHRSLPSSPVVNNSPQQWNNSAPNASSDWNAGAQWGTDNSQNESDGWGEGPPSYTSISQGTYFGFTSIMEAPTLANAPSQSAPATPASQQAFHQFKHTPVSFTSAAAEHNKQNKQ